jgi:hypothetical protein
MTTIADNTTVSIISDAMREAGLLQQGQVPNSEDLARYLARYIEMVNTWQTQGLKLWLNVDTEITLVEGTGTYDLGPAASGGTVDMTKPLRAIEAYYKDDTGIRRPLVPLSWDDYIRLSQVNQTGSINSYFVNKKQSVLSVFFWLIPDETAATGTAHLLLQTQVSRVTNLTETVNFPIEWRLPLMWGLADEICGGQPPAIVSRCQQRALFYRDMLENWDVEDASTTFTPDQRSQYATGAFR